MGIFFTNIHIKKTPELSIEDIEKAFLIELEDKGYHLTDKEDEAVHVLKICDFGSEWFSVASDYFEFSSPQSISNLYMPLSGALNTDIVVMGCFDSEYIYLNLLNKTEGIDAWLNIGGIPGLSKERRSNKRSWKKKVIDYGLFERILKESQTDPPLFLENSEHIFMMNRQQIYYEVDFFDCSEEMSETDSPEEHCLYFSGKEVTNKESLPSLRISDFVLTPNENGKESNITAISNGSKSKGLGVLITLKNGNLEEVKIENAHIGYMRYKSPIAPVDLKKCMSEDGRDVYYWEDRSFPLFQKVRDDLPMVRKAEAEFNNTICLWFTPYGEYERLQDIQVTFIPLKNPANSCTWCVWDGYPTKEAYFERIKFLSDR